MRSTIADTLRDGTVLITGGTGFLGKVLTEKLLRSVPIKTIAILIRSKTGLTAEQQIADVYKQTVLFNGLQKNKPDFMKLIKVIDGNLKNPNLGLSLTDREWLIENVNFVFHCAGTVRLNVPLDVATKINVLGTKQLLDLATEMKCLKGFVYVSTAYSHYPRNEIGEQYYSVPITAEDLLNKVKLNKLSLNILEGWPNTYLFTKAIAENLIYTNNYHLPISVFRPSIVGSAMSEPDPGWLESMNGPSNIVTETIIGFLSTIPSGEDKKSDIVPVDYTVNALISVMWDTAIRYQDENEKTKKPRIYNYVSSVESPLTWNRINYEIRSKYHETPPLQLIWLISYKSYTNLWIRQILKFWIHRIPAAVFDLLLISGKNTKSSKVDSKIERMLDINHEFTTREWVFDNSNTREMWSLLDQEERELFWFSLKDFDWSSYMTSFYNGIRKYILEEDKSICDYVYGTMFFLQSMCSNYF